VRSRKGQWGFRSRRRQALTRAALHSTRVPSTSPVELRMKCVLVQARHTTGEWWSFLSSGMSAGQCCTFIPVSGHLNMMGRAIKRKNTRLRVLEPSVVAEHRALLPGPVHIACSIQNIAVDHFYLSLAHHRSVAGIHG
jgi:hypothetical protein